MSMSQDESPEHPDGGTPTSSARTKVAGDLARESWRRPWRSRVAAYVVSVAVTVPAIWICDWALSDFHADWPGGPVAFAAVLGLVAVVVQPLLVGAAVRLGWLGVLVLAFVGQALIVFITAWLLPNVTLDSYWAALAVAVAVGLVSTVLTWFGSAGTSQVLVGKLVASSRRRPAEIADPDVDGVLFVQLDGVPFPVLQMAVTAGTVPTLSPWIRSGTHTVREWTPKLPATTPASQMGILHGVIDGIPAFRWYDRARDCVMVANKPADAAVIEADLTTSDHGQAQGTPFADRYGEDLSALVARLAQSYVAASEEDVEGWGRTQALVDELAGSSGLGGRTMKGASEAMDKRARNQPGAVTSAPGGGDAATGDRTVTGEETFHVFGSGNLGLVYVRGEKEGLDRAALDARFPALVDGLARHPGIGFVVVRDHGGPVVLGNHGSRRVDDGHVEGADPLAPFGPYAPEFVKRVAHRPEAPDIYVNSVVDPGTEEVAAFEDLVGCHGGLGGWQDRASVVVPVDLPFPAERVVGADAMHVALRSILRHCGHRQGIVEPDHG